MPLAVSWVQPVTNDTWSEDGVDWFIVGLMIAVTAAATFGGYAASRDHRRVLRTPRWAQIALALVAAPAVFGLAGLGLKPMHDRQTEAAEAFDAYTHRFPDGQLGAKFIEFTDDGQTNMCASERSGMAFCIAVDHGAPRGRQVVGGYRLDYEGGDEFGPALIDCFGDLGCAEEPGSERQP